jgi:hypothetical protein
MLDKQFMKWWLTRISPHADVPNEKLAAEREAVERHQQFNDNYMTFLQEAVLPAVDELTKVLRANRIVHRVSTWGNQLSIRVHLSWRWGELVIMQSHEDCVTFDHHILNEGEKRGEDTSDDHAHQYDLLDPLPQVVAQTELQFFMTRLAHDLMEPLPELPPEGQGS